MPAVLEANPHLLGYYRLLMGYSQKEFYGRDKGFGVGCFKSMEEKGKAGKAAVADLHDLCVAFCAAASALLAGVGPLRVSRELLDDLTLLTVGPQLRGGANNQRGADGIVLVFEIIREIVAHAAAEVRESAIEVNSATGRPVLIEFAPDPDIIIRRKWSTSITATWLPSKSRAALTFPTSTTASARPKKATKRHDSAALPSAGLWSMSGGWIW